MATKSKSSNAALTALLTILLGILLLVQKGQVIQIALTVLGVALILLGAVNLIKRYTVVGVVQIAAGVVTLVFGWSLVKFALYVLAAILIFYGVLQTAALLSLMSKTRKKSRLLLAFVQPVIYLVFGIALLIYHGSIVSWMFTVGGICLIVSGVLSLLGIIE